MNNFCFAIRACSLFDWKYIYESYSLPMINTPFEWVVVPSDSLFWQRNLKISFGALMSHQDIKGIFY